MGHFTFTFFTENNKVYAYRFGITRKEAQETAEKIFSKEGIKVYYMDGYFEE